MNIDNLRETIKLRFFTFFKIPLIYYCRPRVLELSLNRCKIIIPFKRRNKNHIGSMYFGAIAVGADLAGGLIALDLIKKSGRKIQFVFKSVIGNYLRRIESDALFVCENGREIREAIAQTSQTGERVYIPVKVEVTCPKISPEQLVATFDLELSMKDISKR